MRPKEITLKRIANRDAKTIILANYRSGTMPSGVKLSLGCFVDGRCLGVVVFSVGSRFIHTVIEGGESGDVWELARLWLSDELPKNSESRVLSVSIKVVRKYNPDLKAVVTYTDHGVQLYKGAGWQQVPGRFGDTKEMTVDGVTHFSSRAVGNRYGTLNVAELKKRGHKVEVRQGVHRTKWIYWLHAGSLACDSASEEHPLEKSLKKIWRTAEQWLGWPGTETIRRALKEESFAAAYDGERLIGAWLLLRLKKRAVFRDAGCCVDPAYRGRGIGRQLADQVKRLCDDENRLLTFDCNEKNPANAFWLKMGFSRVGARPRGKNRDNYLRYVYKPAHAPVE